MSIDSYLNTIICGDCLEVMRGFPDGCIDLFITSPPYNLRNSTGNGMRGGASGKWGNAALCAGYEDYSDDLPHEEYVAWQRACLSEMMRLLKDDGAIFYNHKWRVQGGLLQDRSDIVSGFPVRQIIIWKRRGGINFNDGYFLPTYEVVYLIAKPSFKLLPRANAVGDVWEFMQETNNPHPAPFPVNLVKRILDSTGGAVVCDPFMGSGTTAVGCVSCGRDYIGIELSSVYCSLAEERIRVCRQSPTLF